VIAVYIQSAADSRVKLDFLLSTKRNVKCCSSVDFSHDADVTPSKSFIKKRLFPWY